MQKEKDLKPVLLAFRFWKQKGYNPWDGDDSWDFSNPKKIRNKNMDEDMKAICMHYGVTVEELNVIIKEHIDRDISSSFAGLGGCVPRRNNLQELFKAA